MRSIARKNHGVVYLPLRTPCLHVDSPIVVRRLLGTTGLRKMVASRSTATTAAVSSREKKLRFKTRRDNARVLRFHYRTLLIKVNALTSLITGADETLRRGADTDESRANHTINRTRRPTGRTQEARTWSLAALLSRACALHLTSYTVAVDYWNIYESNSTLTEF